VSAESLRITNSLLPPEGLPTECPMLEGR
jgi:hypothetical protein